ncbi:MAG: glutamate--tRNA ligase [Treponema sp.]|jgi:glutamyl-tRNA synthetase|nr:glutamate--tRNA ligase [Treponema sp.]
MHVRTRYAPSPTGLQHIGGVRTALFNYLFARSQGGHFIVRLEDTDRSRFDPAFVQNLYETFDWLNIQWDEGPRKNGPYQPYIQSERLKLYQQYAQQLVERGQAYYCFCSAQRLEALRAEREQAHSRESGYDRRCRTVDPAEAAARVSAGESYTVRLKIPLDEQTIHGDDVVLGAIEWNTGDISPDPVLLKSDGFPTYHLANVVDDHAMEITHVLRAQEWLPSTPLHIVLYRAFGWQQPLFCHLPMVLGQDGKKLSKRHGATSVAEFRKQGYTADALLNYLALLGCSYQEGKELYSVAELADLFALNKLNKAPAVFDYKKLDWYNAQYIKAQKPEDLARLALPFALDYGLFGTGTATEAQTKLFIQSMPLIQERAVTLKEIPEKIHYLFAEPPVPAAAEYIPKKLDSEITVSILKRWYAVLESIVQVPHEQQEAVAKAQAESLSLKVGDVLLPLRVAITGSRVSPPLFESLTLLGAARCKARIERALQSLQSVH